MLTVYNDSWSYTEPYFQVSNVDIKSMSKMFRRISEPFLYKTETSKVLLINDGLQIIYNSLVTPVDACIVEPKVYEFTQPEYKEIFNTVEYKNSIDSLGCQRKLALIDETFEEAYFDTLYTNKYDHIFLIAKNKEDLTRKNIEKYFLLLRNNGYLFIMKPSTLHFEKQCLKTLDHYFVYQGVRRRTTALGVINTYLSYLKLEGLV